MSEPPKESQPTEESSRRLAIAKEMYLQGSYNAAKHSTIGSILAVLNMDYSAETIVKSILIEEGVVIAGESFPELCKNLQSRHKKLKLLSAIQDLHKLRNNVQHHGMVPSPQDITRHRNTIRYFFDEVCDVIYDGEIAYDSISLALFIDSS